MEERKSTHRVEVVSVHPEPHPNADRLEAVRICPSCICGCGELVSLSKRPPYQPNQYIHGHFRRGRQFPQNAIQCILCGLQSDRSNINPRHIKGMCNPCYYRTHHNAYMKKNPHKRSEIQRRQYNKLRTEVFIALGNRCACCNESRKEFLTLDHINGGGTRERKSTGGVWGMLRRIKANGFPSNLYRILCWNCNEAYAHFGYCPHRIQGTQ